MSEVPSSYLSHLPQIFRASGTADRVNFLGRFLKIFEALLSGRDDAVLDGRRVVGLEEIIAEFADYLDPALTPIDDPDATAPLTSEFLDYLAGWVALTLDQNWDLGKKREWLRRIVPLYKRRGTRDGIAEYLEMFIGPEVTVEELSGGFFLGIREGERESSTVGESIYLAGAPAYYFRVRINYGFHPQPFDIETWRNIHKGARAIVDREKPAHTYYNRELDARTPGIIVGNLPHATLGETTLIWQNSRRL